MPPNSSRMQGRAHMTAMSATELDVSRTICVFTKRLKLVHTVSKTTVQRALQGAHAGPCRRCR